ncbi:hypothetical protein P7C70_g6722, partial [Phenoliferia sp. Uapishka_3]
MRPLTLALPILSLLSPSRAWGAVGHEIVATIAQIHLHPSAKSALQSLLPEYTNGHLAPVASWADRVRMFRLSAGGGIWI